MVDPERDDVPLSALLRAARALLDLRQKELAHGSNGTARVEKGDRAVTVGSALSMDEGSSAQDDPEELVSGFGRLGTKNPSLELESEG